ncbi:MAG: hypothetical protein KGL39_53340 [Patescibacteria group bacterium]|nr:hypothetical protein [Patescibacteria group bacterium]
MTEEEELPMSDKPEATDLTTYIEDDGRIRVEPGCTEQLISGQLLKNADPRFLRVEGDRVIIQGYNGTWTYRILAHEMYYGAEWVRCELVESSDVGTDERVKT